MYYTIYILKSSTKQFHLAKNISESSIMNNIIFLHDSN